MVMKVSKLVGEHFKEAPADCTIESHSIMVRGGYIKGVGAGIYSLYPPTKRITRKIENILREEMDNIGGQEVLFPVVMPASLWKESGRYDSIGSELLRFTDRTGTDMVLGMTHEEASVQMCRVAAQTYTKYPYMIYQIQTKFRDEPRARGGLIRVREFTMKDAYSFHTSWEDLQAYYQVCYDAYMRIFRRCGLKQFIAVKSDSGMMGGSISHEFMSLTDIGEDTLVICPECGYSSNMEAADCKVEPDLSFDEAPLELVETPNMKTIADVAKFLGRTPKSICKAVVYQENATDKYVIAYLRGDLEVNETKLRNYLKTEIHPAATITAESGIVEGFIGPVGGADCRVVFDKSLVPEKNLACGANKLNYHYTGFNLNRDCPNADVADFAKSYEGAECPVCGKHSITIKKGIEIGNIFQLGTKYTKSMNMEYIDKDGTSKNPIMGCYGIGVGRLAASVCQESRDEYGPIWPMSIAPWQVEVCNLRADDETVSGIADKLAQDLDAKGVEVLYDDRNVRPGVMFADADLYGIPVRAVVSPKTCERSAVEVSYRDKSARFDVSIDEAADKIKSIVEEMLAQYK